MPKWLQVWFTDHPHPETPARGHSDAGVPKSQKSEFVTSSLGNFFKNSLRIGNNLGV